MRLQGKISNFSFTYSTRKPCITIEVDSIPEELNNLQESILDIDIRKHRQKRSLDANAYAWVLISKLASKYDTSKDEIYELMLRRYGTLEQNDGNVIAIALKKVIPIESVPGHWLPYREKDGVMNYLMIKGSSEYDTEEMSKFITGVVSDCKEAGIETLTPAEIERMVNVWKI